MIFLPNLGQEVRTERCKVDGDLLTDLLYVVRYLRVGQECNNTHVTGNRNKMQMTRIVIVWGFKTISPDNNNRNLL